MAKNKNTARAILFKRKGPFTPEIFVAEFNAIFVAFKLQLYNRACKLAAILARF